MGYNKQRQYITPQVPHELMDCAAMIPPWTMLDHTVNQMRLRCANGFREAIIRNTRSLRLSGRQRAAGRGRNCAGASTASSTNDNHNKSAINR